MGEATVSLVRLEVDRQQEILVSLADAHCSEYLGQIELYLRLQPKRSSADGGGPLLGDRASLFGGEAPDGHMPISFKTAATTAGMAAGSVSDAPVKRPRGQSPWSAVVNVVLIEGRDLLAMDFEGTSDPYCKFR